MPLGHIQRLFRAVAQTRLSDLEAIRKVIQDLPAYLNGAIGFSLLGFKRLSIKLIELILITASLDSVFRS